MVKGGVIRIGAFPYVEDLAVFTVVGVWQCGALLFGGYHHPPFEKYLSSRQEIHYLALRFT